MAKKKSRNVKFIEVILIVLGTTFVVITFLIHDVKLEKLKEFKAEIAKVEEETLIRDDLMRIGGDVKQLFMRFERLEHPIPSTASDEFMWTFLYEQRTRDGIVLQNAQQSLSNLTLLALSLEDPQKYASRILELKRTEEQLAAENGHIIAKINNGRNQTEYIKLLRNDAQMSRLVAQSAKTEMKECLEKSQVLVDPLQKFFEDHRKLVQDITSDITDSARAAKESYERYTRLSYYIIAGGFLLGLAGKLIGIESDETAE